MEMQDSELRARIVDFSPADIKQMSRALINLNSYFEGSKHWGSVWTSRAVKDVWRSLWVSSELASPSRSATWTKAEIPTVAQLDLALEIWYRCKSFPITPWRWADQIDLFIFSIPVPDKIPPIFQASHHSVSAAYGIVCKIKRNCTLKSGTTPSVGEKRTCTFRQHFAASLHSSGTRYLA